MRFMPHTEANVRAMLDAIGVGALEDLIAHVPANLRETAAIALAPGLAEQDVAAEVTRLASKNRGSDLISFLGGGYYNHYVPAIVRSVISRAEFATSYTPYQAEASQGTTQAIFEFQTLITQLTGLEVANASMYDGASAAAEAVLMARRIAPKRSIVALARSLWPDYRATIRTYLAAVSGVEVVELPFDAASGQIDLAELSNLAKENLLCVVAGYPNGFGIIESLGEIAKIAHQAGALAIAATAESLALGLLKAPGDLGIDIAVGEGQSFGLPLQFGGPGLGFMAARNTHLRQMPGRLVGQTRDVDGHRAFTLTLATREQHIRRERATSNICTNHSLCALAATVYLSLMGRHGLRDLAERNVELAHQAHAALAAANLRPRFSGPFFNEFVVKVPHVARALAAGEARGVLAGLALATDYPELDDGLLVAVTESNSASDICAARRSAGGGELMATAARFPLTQMTKHLDPKAQQESQREVPLIFELSEADRRGVDLSARAAGQKSGAEILGAELCRDDLPGFPELHEPQVLRHFLRLSHLNFAQALQFYPLGSCTMKYNPLLNDEMAALRGFTTLHPRTPAHLAQGALELMARLEAALAEITGMDAVTLHPAAGAQGELTG